ncbi:hypothetical protein HZS_2731 [Henneguya salminicola]|nr:hypothetical protein HZS_2731 [Henneguya salminicola]
MALLQMLFISKKLQGYIKNRYKDLKCNHTRRRAVADRPDVVYTTEEMLSLSISRVILEFHLSAAKI